MEESLYLVVEEVEENVIVHIHFHCWESSLNSTKGMKPVGRTITPAGNRDMKHKPKYQYASLNV